MMVAMELYVIDATSVSYAVTVSAAMSPDAKAKYAKIAVFAQEMAARKAHVSAVLTRTAISHGLAMNATAAMIAVYAAMSAISIHVSASVTNAMSFWMIAIAAHIITIVRFAKGA